MPWPDDTVGDHTRGVTTSPTGPTFGSTGNRTVRIGDRERDRAVECLREHVTAGRLDQTEFEQRIEAALTARFAADLDPLFIDLPAPRPDLPTARSQRESAPTVAPEPKPSVVLTQQPTRPPGLAAWRALTTVVWVAAIVACIASGWHLWFLMLIPLLMGGAMGGGCGRRQRRTFDDRRVHVHVQRLDRRPW
jgi:hypothetical protein